MPYQSVKFTETATATKAIEFEVEYNIPFVRFPITLTYNDGHRSDMVATEVVRVWRDHENPPFGASNDYPHENIVTFEQKIDNAWFDGVKLTTSLQHVGNGLYARVQ